MPPRPRSPGASGAEAVRAFKTASKGRRGNLGTYSASSASSASAKLAEFSRSCHIALDSVCMALPARISIARGHGRLSSDVNGTGSSPFPIRPLERRIPCPMAVTPVSAADSHPQQGFPIGHRLAESSPSPHPSRSSVHRQVHPAQERLPARVLPDLSQERIRPQPEDAGIALVCRDGPIFDATQVAWAGVP